MKKIAILKRDAQRSGGLEKQTRYIVDALKKRGTVVTLVSKEKFNSPFSYKKIEEYDAYCDDFLAKNPHDVVLGMDRNRRQTHLRAGNGVHAAYLELRKQFEGFFKGISFSLNPLHRTILKFEKEAFEHPELQALIVNSKMVEKQILSHYKVDPQKIHVIHNGVELDESDDALEKDEGRFEFLFVGHNFQRKGLHKLLDALSALAKPDVHLSVVGEDKNLPQFREMTKKLGLNVTFHGKQQNMRPFYKNADALVIPSFYDPFANVTVEALAMGLFVVSSKTNGGHEILSGENGVVIESLDDKESFVFALEAALSRPKTKQRAKAIRHSVRHLNLSDQLEKLCDLCLS